MQCAIPQRCAYKIYLLDGRTLFSTDAAQIGTSNGSDPGFLVGKAGHAAKQDHPLRQVRQPGGELADRDVLSSYIPLRSSADAPIKA